MDLKQKGERVCVIVRGWDGFFDKDEYKFYIVDRDSYSGDEEFVPMKPTLVFSVDSSSYAVSFCALNSTIYMFEGDFLDSLSEGQFAAKFEITRQILLSGSPYELDRNKDFVPIGPMCARKYSPIALPTPDCKHILVFSSEFTWRKHRTDLYLDSFELYNVADNSWKLCQPLPRDGDNCPHYRIVVYGFEGDSHFVIQISNDLVFVLDLQTRAWKPKTHRHPQVKGPYFIGIDEFDFTPHLAYDHIGGIPLPFQPPPGSTLSYDEDDDVPLYIKQRPGRLYPIIALLGHDEKKTVYDMGVVQVQRPPSNITHLHIILNIYSVDISDFRGDVEGHKRDVEKYREKYRENYEGGMLSFFKKCKEQYEEKYRENNYEGGRMAYFKKCYEKYNRGMEYIEQGQEQEQEPQPLFKTTIATKSFKRWIEYNSAAYVWGQIYLFSI